jgi:hypothetical protein
MPAERRVYLTLLVFSCVPEELVTEDELKHFMFACHSPRQAATAMLAQNPTATECSF